MCYRRPRKSIHIYDEKYNPLDKYPSGSIHWCPNWCSTLCDNTLISLCGLCQSIFTTISFKNTCFWYREMFFTSSQCKSKGDKSLSPKTGLKTTSIHPSHEPVVSHYYCRHLVLNNDFSLSFSIFSVLFFTPLPDLLSEYLKYEPFTHI